MLNKHLPKFITLSLSITLALVGLICVLELLGRLSQVAHAQGGTGAIYVHPTGNDFVGCGAYGLPCRTIKYAVENEAQPGDVVEVASGTYTQAVIMQPGVVISGAGAGVTFIDGEGVRGPMVSVVAGVTESAVLRGFTIQNGKNNVAGGGGINISSGSPLIENCTISHNLANGQSGGGVYIGGSPTLSNNVIFSNESTGSGGGIYIGGGAPVLEYNTIYSNTSANGWGGGIYKWDGTAILQYNTIYSNAGVRGGGGIYNYDGPLTLQNNMIHRNWTAWGFNGGGIYIISGTVTLYNNTIYGNIADNGAGGGVYIEGAASPVISNNIVVSNTAGSGGGIYFNDYAPTGSPTLDYNDVWGNTASNPGTDNYYAVTAGVHSISSDPKFVDAANNDFHLAGGSPCINAGDPNTSLNTDFEGDSRPFGGDYDIGADESQSSSTNVYLPVILKNS